MVIRAMEKRKMIGVIWMLAGYSFNWMKWGPFCYVIFNNLLDCYYY